jgi:hypothetical protein
MDSGTINLLISLGFVVVALVIVVWGYQVFATRRTKAAVTSSDEYRRISELAVTAQEHTDLKLGEINMQLAQLRSQLEQVQKILNDIE